MFTQNSLPTDSTAGPFPIGFNYLDGATITVTRYDLDGTTNPVVLAFTFAGTVSDNQPSGSTIILSAAQAAGKLITITKTIDLDTPALTWNQGAEITQKNLRKTTRNLMEMAQSAWDKAFLALTRNQAALDGIASVVPSEVLVASASIAADRVLAQAAATTAQASAVTVAAFGATHFQSKVTLDFGAALNQKTKIFVVAVAGVLTTDYIRCTHVLNAVAGRDQDENEMDSIMCKAVCLSNGNVTIYAESLYGSVTGQYNFVLTF